MNTHSLKKWVLPVIGSGILIILVMWQMGLFYFGKIKPGRTPAQPDSPQGRFVPVEQVDLPETYRAAGTVTSRTHIDISPRIVARILEITVRAGDRVTNGTLLLRLDDADLRAAAQEAAERVKAARAALSAAEEKVRQAQAAYDLASVEAQRMRQLLGSGAISQQALDTAESRERQTRALLAQAEQGRLAALADVHAAEQAARQAQALLSYATIFSPSDAVVAERLADPGDLASPGKVLLRLFDPSRLMLEVPIRESLVQRLKIGDHVPFHVAALGKTFLGDIREIVPAVDPGSRTFKVKICIGEAPGLVPGMFGTLELPLGTRRVLLITETAVSRAGQLEFVIQKCNGTVQRTLVRTIPAGNGKREVVSGLTAGAYVRIKD
ncbi:MAG: efflux RND transporter periplasmic adaptor subunit [bacterium]|nr:efflux RND transporter periplasmic adaptor subunit [bacterium]